MRTGTEHRDPPLVYQAGEAQVIAVADGLELSTVEQIEHAALTAVPRHGRIVLDLTAVVFIANPELVALITALRRLRQHGAWIAIAGGDPRARDVLLTIGLEGVAFTASVHGALTTLQQASPADRGSAEDGPAALTPFTRPPPAQPRRDLAARSR